jgi:hypothetical protein
MITNEEYLVQKYAEARERMNIYNGSGNTDVIGANYWRGAMDTYLNLLYAAFPEWDFAIPNTTGYYVFMKGMTYDEALNQITVS